MEILLGFGIAFLVGTTGIGGGSLTVPLLILGLGVPATQAVGVALLFTAVAKVVSLPVFMARRAVDYRIAAWQMLGGLPGVWLGSLALKRLDTAQLSPVVLAAVGMTIVLMAACSLYRSIHPRRIETVRHRPHWLPWFTFPIGVEVGFSSAGAGALGVLTLLRLTKLEPAMIVGTDLLFGLGLSLAGGALHWAGGNLDLQLLLKLCAGGFVGALAGAGIATRVPARPLRTALTAALILLGIQLSWNGLSQLWILIHKT